MAQTAQRTAKRVLLGHELAYFRARLGISQTELGKTIGKSQSKIGWLEQGQATVTSDQLGLLIKRLEITDPSDVAAIRDLHRDSNKKGEWTTGFNRVYAESVRLLIDLERHADQIFTCKFEIMPGLLQCPSYVRSLSNRNRLPRGVTAEHIAQAWQMRQEILERPGGPLVHFVLSESSLRRRWAPPDVMQEQMAHLITLSHKPNVRIQILTFDDSETEDLSPIGHDFTLLRVPSPGRAGDLHMAYNEGVKELFYRDEPKALDAHEEAKADMVAAARNPEDSRQFISYISNTFLPGAPTHAPSRSS